MLCLGVYRTVLKPCAAEEEPWASGSTLCTSGGELIVGSHVIGKDGSG